MKFKKNPNINKKKKFFFGGGGGVERGARVSDFFFTKKTKP